MTRTAASITLTHLRSVGQENMWKARGRRRSDSDGDVKGNAKDDDNAARGYVLDMSRAPYVKSGRADVI